MKKNAFFMIFIAANIIMIFLIIYKQSLFTKFSYKNQQLEKEYQLLLSKKESLERELYQLQDSNQVKQFAQQKLGMSNLSLKQVKKSNQSENAA